MSIRSAPGLEQRPAPARPAPPASVEPAGVGERVRRGVDDPHQPWPPAQLERLAAACAARDRERSPARPRSPRRRPPAQNRPPPRSTRSSSHPSSRPIARATRVGTSLSACRARAPASSPSRVRRSSTSPTLRACSCRAENGGLGEQVRQSGHDRLRQLAALGGHGQHVLGRVAVAVGRAPRRSPRRTPSTRGRLAGSIGCPSGISCVRHGASRPSRSTSRSTASLAIRRQVVSLPPVIVISPLEVSYSSALREMSTDLRVSPEEISGRTPA